MVLVNNQSAWTEPGREDRRKIQCLSSYGQQKERRGYGAPGVGGRKTKTQLPKIRRKITKRKAHISETVICKTKKK